MNPRINGTFRQVSRLTVIVRASPSQQKLPMDTPRRSGGSGTTEHGDGFVREYKLWKLENSYTPKFEVLDGYMWHTSIRYEKGSVSTGGSNAWPPAKLQAGLSAIESYIQSIIDSATPSDILGTTSHPLDR